MVKYLVGERKTKFTRELNTYGFDKKGMGEELLFPIRLNGEPGENKETNLATYLIKYKEFEKADASADVKITKVQNKEGFVICIHRNKWIDFNFTRISSLMLAGGLFEGHRP